MSTPSQRTQAARIAALTRWKTEDTAAGIAPARRGFMAKFEREVDPDGELDPRERAVRAERAMKLHMARLGLSSSKSRARQKARKGP